MDSQPQLPHKLTLNERRQLTMTGVTEVVSFDETAVVLHTSLGTLLIQGRDLKLKTLSLDGLNYEEPRSRGGWASRLFK